jgi:MerR family transcriptional regulator, copper efflux regulator
MKTRATKRLTIGQVAGEAAVGVETVRFYEREGLIPPPPRTSSGYRQYPADTVERLCFIQRAKDLGFSLRETRELLSLRVGRGRSAADVRARAAEKVADISRKIRDLEAMRESLRALVTTCSGQGSTDTCPILVSLSRADGVKGE